MGDAQPSALCVVAVDVFGLTDAADLIDGIEHFAVQAHARFAPRRISLIRVQTVGFPHTPPTVAAARAIANGFRFEHRDIERRVFLLEIVGRPQSGKARADDGNLGFRRQFGYFRFGNLAQGIEPEADIAIRICHTERRAPTPAPPSDIFA